MSMPGRLPLASLTVLTLACAQTPPAADTAAAPDTAGAVAAINSVREREISAFSSGNVEELLSVVTSDAYVMPPNEPAVSGHDALRTWAQTLANQFTINARYTGSTVTLSGDYAFERYTGELTVTPKAGGAAMSETFKGVHVYQRQADGSWKIHQDIWNSNVPPDSAAAQAAAAPR